MEEESWWWDHGGGIMVEESWRRNLGEGIMEEESWKRSHGGRIIALCKTQRQNAILLTHANEKYIFHDAFSTALSTKLQNGHLRKYTKNK